MRGKKISQAEAEAQCTDMVAGQKWHGTAHKYRYRFVCATHGEYRQRFQNHRRGQGCERCQQEARRVDRTGERFGKWIVLAKIYRHNGSRGRTAFRCRCDCGTVKIVSNQALKKSKACWRCLGRTAAGHPIRLPGDLAARNATFGVARARAQRRGYEWKISRTSFDRLSDSLCFYCGAGPLNVARRWKSIFRYNGIDRVDNSKGYLEDNVVACCSRCNDWKWEMKVEDFLAHAKQIVEQVEKRNG